MSKTNLILVTFDALRRDAVGLYGGPGAELDLTPNLDRYAEDATTFLKPYANGPATEHSFVSTLASRYSHETGRNNLGATFLGEMLSESGYHTAAFHSNPVLLSHNNFHRGFDVYPGKKEDRGENESSTPDIGRIGKCRTDLESLASHHLEDVLHWNPTVYSVIKGTQFALRPPYDRASTINDRCFDHISSSGQDPIFLWVHYMDTHDPYLPTGEYLDLEFTPDLNPLEVGRLNTWLNIVSGDDFDVQEISEETVADLRSLYHAQVRRVDDAFGALIERLQSEGLYEDSLVVVGSDHGEQFLEHGWIRHSRHLYDELLKVPLMIKPPSGAKFEPTVSGLTSYIDIAPTFLDYADVEVPASMRGRSLRSAIETGESPRESVCAVRIFGDNGDRIGAVRQGDWKLIIDERQDREELYNVKEDPGETSNRITEMPDVRVDLKEILEERTDWSDWSFAEFRSGGDTGEVPIDVQQQLKDLGYR